MTRSSSGEKEREEKLSTHPAALRGGAAGEGKGGGLLLLLQQFRPPTTTDVTTQGNATDSLCAVCHRQAYAQNMGSTLLLLCTEKFCGTRVGKKHGHVG